MSPAHVFFLVVASLSVAGLVYLFPVSNKALKAIVAGRTGAGAKKASSAEDVELTAVEGIRDRLYFDRGIAPRSPSAIVLTVVIPAIFGFVVVAVGEGFTQFLGFVLMISGPAIIYVDASRRSAGRRKAFAEALPQFLLTVASAVSAGLTLDQALRELSAGQTTVVEEEFHFATQGLSLGESLEDALDVMARRMDSGEISTLRRATAIGRQTGSSLTPILETVAESSLERSQVRREIGTLTAEGLMSAYVVIALPFLVFLFLLLSQPQYVSVLWTRPEGIGMGAGALVLIAVGWVWLRRLIGRESRTL